ncbi:MAG: phosphoenolpyruvate synthase [Armatimonadaceae bacterium]
MDTLTPILWPEDPIPDTEIGRFYGGKAGALRRMGEADLPIPPWFVVSPRACQLQTDADGMVTPLPPSPEVCAALNIALQRLCANGERVAVRSSAVDEDGGDHSFAGQLESYLWVAPEDVSARVQDVWCSGFTERVRAYRAERGLSTEPQPPAVLVQVMVDAGSAGVAFSADPVSGRRGTAVVAAVWGLGDALVGGDADADTWEVDGNTRITARTIAEKRTAHRPNRETGGTVAEAVPEAQWNQPALSDAQVQAVAELARKAARHAGRPQDIEWASSGAALYLLQSRPITTLGTTPDPEGRLQVWDNSNIAESYNGVTTPLTFSFARNAYEEVYREFCRLLRVPDERIGGSERAFRNLLGLVQGRVYYNLPNWYRILALLPGYQMNRTFMEQMMGVREPLSDEVIGRSPVAPTASERRRDTVAFVASLFGLIGSYRRLPRTIQAFYARLDTALAPQVEDFAKMRPDELAAHYHDLERQLLTRWDAPLVNDFFAMIFHGLLRRLGEKWLAGVPDAENLHNDLVSGEGGIISAEPAQRVTAMAKQIAGDSEAIAALCELPPLAALRWTRRERPELARELDAYLAKFGDRCLEELKLESATLHDDPTPLVRSVGSLARWERNGKVARETHSETDSPRLRAEATVAAALKANLLRNTMYQWVLWNARERVRDRENLRFERTRVFGRVRRIFLEMGRRFYADGLLDEPRDVFYLEVDEILGVVEGTATCTDLHGLVNVRRAEFDRFRSLPSPPDRLETRGMVVTPSNGFSASDKGKDSEQSESDDARQGLACCPGVVRATVRVIRDPRGAMLEPGSILVAERTDPGWILLFPAAAGVLVERGSLLSHSAIVAREMRIPCIVSVPGVTDWLQDGDMVEMNGSTGWVRRENEEE